MTSALGGVRGPKSRQKEQNQLIYVHDQGGGGQKSKSFADIMYGSPLMPALSLSVVVFNAADNVSLPEDFLW